MQDSVEKQSIHCDNKEEQLEYLMRRFGNQVMKIAYYYLRDVHQAQDIYQEVFIRLYYNLEKFRGECSYYTWICRITSNLCKDYLKSAAFRKLITVGVLNDYNKSLRETGRMLEEVEGSQIFRLVMDLPIKYRLPISLYYFEEFTVAEIADILKISESNVKVRLHRGREKLRKLISKEEYI
ncbi:MAG TPA: sigma-70 family RNA polymerase sigma factor [Clostridiales bacterium]|nr:sigma-70 family RNA polymerase sigma factor [Clostridiales bacterium]